MFNYYDNESIRKVVIAFGSLFNNIYVSRKNSSDVEQSRIRVPIGYGPKEKYIRRLEEESGITDTTKVQLTLPRLSFEIASIDYDPARHLNKLNKRYEQVAGENSKDIFMEVPYNIGFSLYLYTRTMDDNLQIIEQILPYFAPEFIVTLKLNDLDTKVDVPIVLNSTAIQEIYEGNFMERRLLASSLQFTAKTRLYPKVETSPITLSSTVNERQVLGDEFDITNSSFVRLVGATGTTGSTGATGPSGGTMGYVPGKVYYEESE